MSDERVPSPSNPADDWKVWLVVNPATWLMPILFAVFIVAIVIHMYVFSIPGMGWTLAS